jgi:hypothetical protein
VTAWWFLVQHSNSIGLMFDIVGAFLLALFGLPPAVSREGTIYVVEGARAVGTDPAAARKAKRYERLGRVGLGLLIIGFALQFVSSVVPK